MWKGSPLQPRNVAHPITSASSRTGVNPTDEGGNSARTEAEPVAAEGAEPPAEITYHSAAHHPDFGRANAAAVRNTPIPPWRELRPEVPPTTEEEALRLVDGASYIASRGPDGITELNRWISVAHGQDWLRRVQVHGAVANDWPQVVRLLLTHPSVRASPNAVDANGYTPLHFATIWGRPGCAVLLLSLGADLGLVTQAQDGGGEYAGATALEMARTRLAKLLMGRLNGSPDIEHLRTEGLELVRILEGVSGCGGKYDHWARRQLTNRFVQRHSPRLIAQAQRWQLGLLRELVLRKRAKVRTAAELAAHEAEEARRKAQAAADAAGPPPTLEEAMEAAGLLKRNAKMLLRQMHKHLECESLADLGKVTRADIAELDEIDPAERRALWHFVTEHQPSETFAMAMAAGCSLKEGKDGEAAAAPKKKKGKKKDGDLTNLLAEGTAGVKSKAGKQAAKKEKGSAGSQVAAGKKPSVTAEVGSGGGGGGGSGPGSSSGKAGGSKKSAVPESMGYVRHWSDEQAALAFIFREDLPTDAFSMIAKQLYN